MRKGEREIVMKVALALLKAPRPPGGTQSQTVRGVARVAGYWEKVAGPAYAALEHVCHGELDVARDHVEFMEKAIAAHTERG